MSQKRNLPNRPNRSNESFQKKHKQQDFYRDIKEIEIPGYFIEATLDLPRYHPHTIWWLAYISRLLKGDSLDSLIENPPWPYPKDPIIISQLIKELIDYQWLIPNWTTGLIDIAPKIKDIYTQRGEIGLAQYYLSFETIKGKWWMDGLQGTPMDIRSAELFHLDFSLVQKQDPYRLKPEISPEELVELINVDLSLLTRMLKIPKKEFEGLLPRAFLSSPFRIVGPKNIRFEMYGDPDKKGQRILPGELAVLEPMLWTEAPEIFGRKPKRKTRLFQWHRSPVEKFARTLEKFPDQLSLLASGQYYKNLGQILIDELKKKDQWIQWYRTGVELVPIAGYAHQFFGTLGEICEGTTELEQKKSESQSNKTKSPDIILMCSSFLNIGNLNDDIGLVDALRYCHPMAKVVIIYGHANDDLPEKQQKDIDAYCSKLFSLEPSLKNRVLMIPAKKRSHEKAILSSEGHWMIGSWNPCSSNPDSTMFEVGVMGKNYCFALEILGVIKEIIEDPVANDLVRILEESYRSGIAKEQQYNQPFEQEIYGKLTTAVINFYKHLFVPINNQSVYEKNLNIIRLALVPFLQRGQVKLINEHLSRDVLIFQIHKTNQDIVIASDRITKGALDRTIVQDILEPNIESKRYLRILWGREWEEEQHISPEANLQIKEVRRAIKDAMEYLGTYIKTSLNPMENHAKFALFDGCRGLITSENLLSYGGEKTEYESRELGVFIESLPIIRFIEGKTIYHRLPLLQGDRTASEMVYRPYEWIVGITDQYYAFDAIKDQIGFDYAELKYLESALEMNHTKPDPNETSDFDRKLLKARWDCYKARQKGSDKSLFLELWRNGIKYYLLLPTSEQKWRPYSLPLDAHELASLSISKTLDQDLQSLNLLENEANLISNNQISLASSVLNTSPSSSDTFYSTTPQTSVIHPIIQEIMQDMVKIPAGSFQMGDAQIREERPTHKVTITQPFYMSKYMVTQELWKKVMGSLPPMPNVYRSPKFPIIYVHYGHVMDFLKKLNSLPGGGGFDLPTDAQWEYACRAGSTEAYCFGNDKELLNEYAWSKLNANAQMHNVGLLKPNAWGLYDMHGLEFEMVKDGWRKYSSESVVDPIGPLNEPNIVCRGGHWGRFPFDRRQFFRCGSRYPVPKDDISFRLSFRLIRKMT